MEMELRSLCQLLLLEMEHLFRTSSGSLVEHTMLPRTEEYP